MQTSNKFASRQQSENTLLNSNDSKQKEIRFWPVFFCYIVYKNSIWNGGQSEMTVE